MARPKKSPTKVVTVKILTTSREHLERIAQDKGWTLNKLCRSILENHVDTIKRKGDK
jgi:hypothetical protein